MKTSWPECDLCKRDAMWVRTFYEKPQFRYQFVCESHRKNYPGEGEFGNWMTVRRQRALYQGLNEQPEDSKMRDYYVVYVYRGFSNDTRFKFDKHSQAFACFKRFARAQARVGIFHYGNDGKCELVQQTDDFPMKHDRIVAPS